MPVINTNVSAQLAQDALKVNSKTMSTAMQQLATGNRINQAKDDAAGLSIGQNMTSQVRGLNQAVRNVNDGINLLQTADGALVETSNMLQRMRELAVQSSNATNSAGQRGYLDKEFKSLQEEISRIGDNTAWNNANVFGSTATAGNNLVFQAGVSAGQTISVTLSGMNATALGIQASVADILSFATAQAAIGTVDTAIETVNNARSRMGATMNQLSYSADNMVNISTNIAASRSTIMDTDYATASATLSKSQIIQQAATAMLAQANQQPQSVLSLIK
jgi:flagellin